MSALNITPKSAMERIDTGCSLPRREGDVCTSEWPTTSADCSPSSARTASGRSHRGRFRRGPAGPPRRSAGCRQAPRAADARSCDRARRRGGRAPAVPGRTPSGHRPRSGRYPADQTRTPRPPSTVRSVPVTQGAASRCATASAMSSGVPTRCPGSRATRSSATPPAGIAPARRVIGVSINPGTTALTRMRGAHSFARQRTSVTLAPLAAAKCASSVRDPSTCSKRCGRTTRWCPLRRLVAPPPARIGANHPRSTETRRAMSPRRCRWHSPVVHRGAGHEEARGPGSELKRRTTSLRARTSTRTARPSMADATRSAPSSLMSATHTSAPTAARRRATPSPMPDPPPVTTVIRPLRSTLTPPPAPRTRWHSRASSLRTTQPPRGRSLRSRETAHRARELPRLP